jgi:RimJ/RimL family protein N-acetyltransferase
MIHFRTATLDDLPEILPIYENARAFMRRSGNPNKWRSHHPAVETLMEDIEKEQLYLCMEQEKIAAVFCYFRGIDPTYVTIYEGQWCNDEPYGVIHRIAVANPGHGIAGKCFHWALSQCQNLRIDTHRDNLPMQRSLQKFGFTRCGIIYLANGEDRIAYHMEQVR